MSVSIALFHRTTQLWGSEYLRVLIDPMRRDRGARGASFGLQTEHQRTRGVRGRLELVLGIEGLGADLSLKVINLQRMTWRARRRSIGTMYNG